MTPETRNSLRAIARQANSELKAEIAKCPKGKRDEISRQVLLKHFEGKVKPLSVSFSVFIWAIGVINGVFTER
ncbi:hypothetical protein [Cronobacter dublinensis]|uniref:hypothetical protein n=1 Tax=Cronobacter dublinensis TaxID=413497 RepID=UPI000517CB72|nr:hypothetical protein [Cronobacter dublinensis]ALB67191.1 hypothetical protein AFK67_12160 [Cronobacter dublinensis subsp. dublinensis LMG 23823]MDI7270761.1 hypothetical protein [Cronobacter dublinensis]